MPCSDEYIGDYRRPPRIGLLSAYRADSHAAWSDWLTRRFPDLIAFRKELPGRHFRWRIRGNPLMWLDELGGAPPDAIVATSMVDLATLRGLQPRLATVPVLYYFHENQFAYPLGPSQPRSIDPQMVQLYGALAADRLAFNSRFNRDSFLDGVAQLLARMPDRVPAGLPDRLAAKADVLPVPINAVPPDPSLRDSRLIVWNHRWEYDKAPEQFAAAVLALAARGIEFRLALLGRRPQQTPEPLERLRHRLGDRVVADGHMPRQDYERILARAGIAVSTALHEFQGLAVLEAASAGATPIVPDALAYPEHFPLRYRYPPNDVRALVERLAGWLEYGTPPAPDVTAWTERNLTPRWYQALVALPGNGATAGSGQPAMGNRC